MRGRCLAALSYGDIHVILKGNAKVITAMALSPDTAAFVRDCLVADADPFEALPTPLEQDAIAALCWSKAVGPSTVVATDPEPEIVPPTAEQTREHSGVLRKCVARKPRKMCVHNRQYSACALCSPHLFCAHGIRRCQCVPCGARTTCPHWRLRCLCKECNPRVLCQHGKRRENCFMCSPHLHCAHGLRYSVCNKCERPKDV